MGVDSAPAAGCCWSWVAVVRVPVPLQVTRGGWPHPRGHGCPAMSSLPAEPWVLFMLRGVPRQRLFCARAVCSL